ncbi:hypothetical protein HanRHA438_Chr08g0353071 [Helianthus annuus]|uniref:Uncharacterized protein n=2 Tax=Helianthus annuus TaxID=4232 RepID=A0A251U8V1_HELAN|nr:uncharacterized protein LOC110873016 isoform X1 [Helianthus annuus]XP_021977625.1 uncharacterized protein LOC110873016 isoform X1 [Helianthus annuus]XP_021977626.1 uncharacterized protein LOC110873016 isoform X1 [Helianthus annuus]XP_021977628.1 uncharacterized protein LOC110873016 isoform X1 [Helianthus annuus]XP_035832478.1 uncharacterized protein LOC110873016 isoform X1 [Helianthus annuus]XP_035832479.1 uncharacterized protein LOC110873016 isoform X1 [Helianthus annuus]XP_035832480.1 un
MGLQHCRHTMFNNPSSSHEHIVEAGNEVLCERSSEFKNDPSLEMSPIVDSSTPSRCLGVSSRRMTRSMKKLDNSKNSNMDSKSSGDASHVSGESQINIRIRDFEDIYVTPNCSDQLSNTSVGNDDIVIARTNMKSCRNKKKNRVDIPQKGVPATHRISPKEAVMNRNMSKTKLPVKRKLITSPKSASSRGKKGSEEGYGSAIILSVESFSGKKSRSGRVLLPPLEFWRNQKVVYDEHGEVCGVEEPK